MLDFFSFSASAHARTGLPPIGLATQLGPAAHASLGSVASPRPSLVYAGRDARDASGTLGFWFPQKSGGLSEIDWECCSATAKSECRSPVSEGVLVYQLILGGGHRLSKLALPSWKYAVHNSGVDESMSVSSLIAQGNSRKMSNKSRDRDGDSLARAKDARSLTSAEAVN